MQGDATIDVSAGIVRIDLAGPVEVCDRSIVAPLFIPDPAAVAVEIGIGETESDRPIHVEEGPIQIPLASPHHASVMEDDGVVRVNADRLVVVGERTVGIAHVIPGIAADIVGCRVMGIEPNGLIEVGDRLVEITATVCRDSALSMEFGLVRQGAESWPVGDCLDAGAIRLGYGGARLDRPVRDLLKLVAPLASNLSQIDGRR